jgi:hypothetical protein
MSIPMDSSFLGQVCAILATDHLVLNIKQRPSNKREEFKFVDDLIYFEGLLYILEGLVYLCILQVCHDFLASIILNSTKLKNSFFKIFGGLKCGRPSKNLCSLMTLVLDHRILGINPMGFYNHCLFSNNHCLPYLWTSSQIYYPQVKVVTSLDLDVRMQTLSLKASVTSKDSSVRIKISADKCLAE